MTRPVARTQTLHKAAPAAASVAMLMAVAAASPLLAEQRADVPSVTEQHSFDAAFADLELSQAERRPEALEILAAERRFEAAPIEVPVIDAARLLGTGIASYYGARFAGRQTASGEVFDPSRLTAAHRSLPFGSKVKVTNRRNGRSVIVRINDRGPFHRNRVIDLSREAARQIGLIGPGHGKVELALLAS